MVDKLHQYRDNYFTHSTLFSENIAPPELTISGPVMVPDGGTVEITDQIVSLSDTDTPLKYVSVVVDALRLNGRWSGVIEEVKTNRKNLVHVCSVLIEKTLT